MGFSAGMSSSSSSSESESHQEARSESGSGGFTYAGSQESVAFEDIFARLFGGAEGAAAGLDPSMLTEAANTLFSSGQGFMGQIGGDRGTAFLEDRLSAENPVLQGQIDLLGEDLGRFFNEQLLPGTTSEAVHGGALGGGRQGVAEGAAMREVGDQFTRGATALRASDIAARDAAAMNLSGNAIGGAQVGFQGMNAMMSVADRGFSAALAPSERLAAILGGPTTLGSSFSTSEDWAAAWSESFADSSASSKSKSSSMSLGFSDRLLKRHIKRIGTVAGHAWYSFQFIWGEWSQGVMADEVPAELVVMHPSGFAMVDYGELLNG
jgi:hypothetical protein